MKKIILFSAFATLIGCTQRSVSNTTSQPIADTLIRDSLIVDSVTLNKTKPLVPLADTSLSSVDAIEYEIIVYDTTHSGIINNLNDCYKDIDGVLTFRGGPLRQANFGGTLSKRPDTIIVKWAFQTEMDNTETKFGKWGGGSGWTGQPLYITWPDSIYEAIKAQNKELTQDFSKTEVIVGSLASKVYFINPSNGKRSRNPISTGNPIKGTISLDPYFNGLLYVGHGVPNGQTFGCITVNLLNNSVVNTYGSDPKAWRGWNAFDSSPIRVGDFVFRPGENGMIYKYFVDVNGKETLHSKLRYRLKGASQTPGIESSMAVYINYGYFADNSGNVLCINLSTLRPVWRYNNIDDCDATPVIDIENGKPYVYSGCEVDKQPGQGSARLAKIDALTGEEIWCYKSTSTRFNTNGKHFDGGFYSTPLLGVGNCDSLIFANRVDNEQNAQRGHFVAINKYTGQLVYEVKEKCYAWSSPVGFTDPDNNMYVLTGDTQGYMYLIDGASGEVICRRLVGINFESSPVVRGNTAIVGSRGNNIFCVSIE